MKHLSIFAILFTIMFSIVLLSGCDSGIKKEDYQMLKTELEQIKATNVELQNNLDEIKTAMSSLQNEYQKLVAENQQLKSLLGMAEPIETPSPEPVETPAP